MKCQSQSTDVKEIIEDAKHEDIYMWWCRNSSSLKDHVELAILHTNPSYYRRGYVFPNRFPWMILSKKSMKEKWTRKKRHPATFEIYEKEKLYDNTAWCHWRRKGASILQYVRLNKVSETIIKCFQLRKCLQGLELDTVWITWRWLLWSHPYHGDNQAHGLSLSTKESPCHLHYWIFKLESEFWYSSCQEWRRNCVNKESAVTHHGIASNTRRIAIGQGWETFLPMRWFLSIKATTQSSLVLWGKPPIEREAITNPNHLILKAPSKSVVILSRFWSSCPAPN